MTRIAVTGMGVLSALGNNKDAFLEGLKGARSTLQPVSSIEDLARYPIQLGCEIRGFDPQVFSVPIAPNRDPMTQRAIAAVGMALHDAGIEASTSLEDVGLSLATCMGGILSRESYYRGKRLKSDPSPHLLRQVPCAVTTGQVAKHFEFGGPTATVVTACAAGTNAVGLASDLIRLGHTEVMVAGGVDPFSSVSFSGFTVLGALSKNQAAPFSTDRTGLFLGEASAFVVLETEHRARARGAPIYGYILGYGLSNDAYHPTSPDPLGQGAVRAMQAALDDAELKPEHIAYVNAHGTGTKYNDEMELHALRAVFGAHAGRLAVSSTKSQVGHTLGAAGAVEVIATLLALKHGFFPATVGCNNPMTADFDFVPNRPRHCSFDYAMSNSFAFGGNTASIVLGRA